MLFYHNLDSLLNSIRAVAMSKVEEMFERETLPDTMDLSDQEMVEVKEKVKRSSLKIKGRLKVLLHLYAHWDDNCTMNIHFAIIGLGEVWADYMDILQDFSYFCCAICMLCFAEK